MCLGGEAVGCRAMFKSYTRQRSHPTLDSSVFRHKADGAKCPLLFT